MRIGLSLTPLFKQNRDGIFTYTQSLFEQFSSRAHTVVPVSFLRNENVSIQEHVDFLGHYELCLLKQLSGLSVKPLDDLENQIDIYHATDYRFIRLKQKPLIATLHDAVPLRNAQWANPALRRVKNILMKQAAKWVDGVIAVSHAEVPELVECWGVEASKISVVHSGVSDFWHQSVPSDEKQTLLEKHGLPSAFILFVGTLQPRKNVERLLDAFKRLPEPLKKNYPMVLVAQRGWSDEGVIKRLQPEIEKGQAYWLQNVSKEALRCFYQSATVFAFPSLYEGFGLPVLEAFASRVPVLTSNVSALPEVAGEAAVLVDPYQVEEMTEKLQQLLTSESLRAECIQKGIERVKQFTWEHCAQNTLDVYRKFL